MFDKEELSIVGSLFGASPEAMQIARERTAFTQGTQAGQNLLGGILGNVGMFAERGAAGLRGALGVQLPEERLAGIRQQATQQFDTNTPQGLLQMAQFLNQQGDAAGARQAVMIAQGQAQRMATLGKTQAETEKALRETVKTIGQTPEGKQVYQQGDTQYILGDGGQRIPYYGALQGKTPKTEVNLGGLAELFAKKEAEAGAKDITEQISKAQDALKTGSKVSRDIAEIEQILPNTFTGQFANFSKTASKTLSAIGIPISDKASNTEVLQALTNNLVLPAVKQLPGSLAAKELAFLQQTKPEALQEPATIKRLLNMIKDDIGVNRVLVKRADEYRKADKLGSLQGFNIALQQDSIYQDLRRYNSLKSAVSAGNKISQAQADFAKKFEQELGLE